MWPNRRACPVFRCGLLPHHEQAHGATEVVGHRGDARRDEEPAVGPDEREPVDPRAKSNRMRGVERSEQEPQVLQIGARQRASRGTPRTRADAWTTQRMATTTSGRSRREASRVSGLSPEEIRAFGGLRRRRARCATSTRKGQSSRRNPRGGYCRGGRPRAVRRRPPPPRGDCGVSIPAQRCPRRPAARAAHPVRTDR